MNITEKRNFTKHSEVRLHIKEVFFNKRVPFSLLHLIKIIEWHE